MTANPDSPNWHWAKLGYQVEHGQRHSRTIRRPDGSAVEVVREDGEDRHSAELRAAELEYRRLPHGQAECLAVQKELPL